MVHLRIIVPSDLALRVIGTLDSAASVCNLVHLQGAALRPSGDVILADVAREEASVMIGELKELGVPEVGSISLEEISSQISLAAEHAEHSTHGRATDAVVWAEVESRTSESVELSASFLAFFVIACLIGAVGVIFDSPILIVGAMVVGPEFGPVAGLCVAVVRRRRDLARRSLRALVIGFPVAITAAYLFTLFAKATGMIDSDFSAAAHPLTEFISHPDGFSVVVAVLAGAAGLLSLGTSKSGALIGVLISVTTIPAASNIAVAAAYQDWGEWRGAIAQLLVNLAGIFVGGITTLAIEKRVFDRRVAHYRAHARSAESS